MTDRQIFAMFPNLFPNAIPRPVKRGVSAREAFWKVNQNRGLTETQIQRAWAEWNR